MTLAAADQIVVVTMTMAAGMMELVTVTMAKAAVATPMILTNPDAVVTIGKIVPLIMVLVPAAKAAE